MRFLAQYPHQTVREMRGKSHRIHHQHIATAQHCAHRLGCASDQICGRVIQALVRHRRSRPDHHRLWRNSCPHLSSRTQLRNLKKVVTSRCKDECVSFSSRFGQRIADFLYRRCALLVQQITAYGILLGISAALAARHSPVNRACPVVPGNLLAGSTDAPRCHAPSAKPVSCRSPRPANPRGWRLPTRRRIWREFSIAGSCMIMRNVSTWPFSCTAAFQSWTGSCPLLSPICLCRWQKRDGSFRARQLLVGWDNVPMHRWAQSQMFRSLCFLLSRNLKKPKDGIAQRFPSTSGIEGYHLEILYVRHLRTI